MAGFPDDLDGRSGKHRRFPTTKQKSTPFDIVE
jgi:hypothetical protein